MSECKLYLNLMPHLDQQNFIYNCLENILVEEKYAKLNVLEIGSHEVGPSQKIREYLKDHNYIGIDLIKGPGVDVVMNGEDIHKFNYKFDIIVSGECFEHAVNWKKIFSEMIKNTTDHGFIILTIASRGRIEHGTSRSGSADSPGTSDDYYLNLTKKHFFNNFDIKKIFKEYFFFYNIHSHDLYFFGSKKERETICKKIKDRTNKENNKIPNFKNLKRYILAGLLPDKMYQDFHFLNKKRKKMSSTK
jgi:hypothetical protein